MCTIKLLTTGEIKQLAAAIPDHVEDHTPVKIEVERDFIKLKHFFSDVLLIRINTALLHPQAH